VRSGQVESFAERVRDALLSSPEGVPTYVERQLVVVEMLTEQIGVANAEIAQQAQHDEVCSRLMSVPGVGRVTALRFVATLDTPQRFADAHRVSSYVGLVPSERSSSDRQRRGAMTKAGQGELRWLLVQVAWSLWRSRPGEAIVQWAERVAGDVDDRWRSSRWRAELGGILFALWRDGTPYDPRRAARRLVEPQHDTPSPVLAAAPRAG